MRLILCILRGLGIGLECISFSSVSWITSLYILCKIQPRLLPVDTNLAARLHSNHAYYIYHFKAKSIRNSLVFVVFILRGLLRSQGPMYIKMGIGRAGQRVGQDTVKYGIVLSYLHTYTLYKSIPLNTLSSYQVNIFSNRTVFYIKI